MEINSCVTWMIMYKDESVDIRYSNGSQLQLSSCGSEFVLEKVTDVSRHHPVKLREKVRQRTRFAISAYKELLTAALAFRNRYASRPYLPEELIPTEHKKPCFGIDSTVKWPEVSCRKFEFGSGGETIIRSEDRLATLTLSPSGEEFSVEFTCTLSQPQTQHGAVALDITDPEVTNCRNDDKTDGIHLGRGQKTFESVESSQYMNQSFKPEELSQSTTVVQQHSCLDCPPLWCYPLSLAHHHWTACPSHRKYDQAGIMNLSEVSKKDSRSRLPRALPLTCPSPHRHRWKTKDPLAKTKHSDLDLQSELVKVVWCQGVSYRILSGAVPVIESYPGDGSVIRSGGALDTYFTHHRPEHQAGTWQVKEVLYHLNSLPPDTVTLDYSISSTVNHASRILNCYNQTKQSCRLPATAGCMQETKDRKYFFKLSKTKECPPRPAAIENSSALQRVEYRTDLVAMELEKIKRFNFLLENSSLNWGEKQRGSAEKMGEKECEEPVSQSSTVEALCMTSRVIQDIERVVSAATTLRLASAAL